MIVYKLWLVYVVCWVIVLGGGLVKVVVDKVDGVEVVYEDV